MAIASSNNGAGFGTEKLGKMTFNYGANIPVSKNSDSYREKDIAETSAKYEDRFDDVGYYEV